MADKSFGVKELNLLNASGTPTITSPNNLNLNANTVAISTSVTIGHNLTVSANAGISSLNVSGIATVFNFNATGISTIVQPADSNPMANWTITNNGASAYRFTGPGQSGNEDNPNIYLVRGHRYIFRHNATGSHPIQIRFANGGAVYTDGVTYSDTGNNRTTDGNNLIFNVQHDAPAQLFYQCTSHGGMVGNIYVVGGPQVISGVVTATSFVGNGAGLTNVSAGLFTSYAVIEDQKGAGANGGTFTSGAWRTRDLNTEIFDPDNIVSISSNQFTLQAGNYFIEASAPAYHVDRHQAALYDITADNFHTVGTNEYAKGDAGTGSRSIVTARVTISSANVYEIRHRCQTTFATYGFGVFIGTSQWITDNNYTYVKIFKES